MRKGHSVETIKRTSDLDGHGRFFIKSNEASGIMDARDRYARMTGDYKNAYKLLESDDEEGFYYTDKMMERTVGFVETAPIQVNRPIFKH